MRCNDDERVIIPEDFSVNVTEKPMQQKRDVRKTFQAIRKQQVRKAEAKMRRTRVLRKRLKNKE